MKTLFAVASLLTAAPAFAEDVKTGSLLCQMSNWIFEERGNDTYVTIEKVARLEEKFSVTSLRSADFTLQNPALPVTAGISVSYGGDGEILDLALLMLDARDGKGAQGGASVQIGTPFHSAEATFVVNEKLGERRSLKAVRLVCYVSR